MPFRQIGDLVSVSQITFHESLTDFSTWDWSPVKRTVFSDTLIFPTYFALASASILFAHICIALRRSSANSEEQSRFRPASLFLEVKDHVEYHGGARIFGFKLVRLISSLTLLALSIATLVVQELDTTDPNMTGLDTGNTEYEISKKWSKRPKHPKPHYQFTKREWLEAAMCLTFLYTSFLALISVTAKPRWSKIVIRHLNSLSFATFVVYFYRDVYPLATFTKHPKDQLEGWLLWLKIALLSVSSIVAPLLIPRQYIPVDPKNPRSTPNPEQTTCLLSLLTYRFLDPVVFYAYRVPHLAWDKLPPLSDRDHTHVLKQRSFKHLDVFSGASRTRHLGFGLLRIFRREYVILCLCILGTVCANLVSPIGMNRLLAYLEHGDDGKATVQPWVWILWLFLGPVLSSLLIQYYVFITTRTLVRTQAIITQLVFEHSLRIRVKAEPADSTSGTSTPAPSTPETASSLNEERSDNSDASTAVDEHGHSRSETLQGSTTSTSTTKQKKPEGIKSEAEPTSDASNLVGKINNLVTTDLDNIVDARDFLWVLVYVPAQITLCMVFLYIVLGWSALVGLAMMLITLPIPGFIAKAVQTVQGKRMKRTDARVQSVTETMNVLRMIKLFGWERKMESRISDKREEELVWIKRKQYLELLNGTINYVIPILTMVATFSCYTLVMKQQLSASIVFSSMSVFDMLRDQLHIVFGVLTATITGKVSLDRVSDFLRNTELLDTFDDKDRDPNFFTPADHSDEIGFRNAIFTWSKDADGSLTPSKRRFVLKVEDELIFKRGCVNLVIGETGSGKTSLLMALLSEMHFVAIGPDSWYNLPRNGGVAYAAQESWVQNETIRENIVFGSEFDEERYKKVIYQCALERDLTLFEAGDKTEVGEKGLTLSGGQKARITLARSVYSKASIILLDDILAALDVHTSKWIVDKCLKGDLVSGRTVILVTHNVAMARPIAGFVVSLKDGRIASQGTMSEALDHSLALKEEAKRDQEAIDRVREEVDAKAPTETEANGRLIVAEEIEEGHVSWPAVKMYLKGMGGTHSWVFFLAVIGSLLISELSHTSQTWFLGHWASQYGQVDPSQVPVFKNIAIYSSFLIGSVIAFTSGYFVYLFGIIRASRKIHKQLVESVLGTTLRWLDTTPVSRVITRCTQDIRAIDGPVAQSLQTLTDLTVMLIVKFFAVIAITPIFLLPGGFITILGLICGQIYIKAQLSVKREMSNARAPVLGHFGAAIAGLTSIRAYGVQQRFVQESIERINRFTRAARVFYNLNRWICIRTDLLGALFASSLAAYLVYFHGQTASNTGFSLNMAVGFSAHILWWIRFLNEFEVQGNSLERIQGYLNIEQEPRPTTNGQPPAYWPASGNLTVEGLSARYSLNGPRVLHDLSFTIRSGERVGVVGRTGSGKSSLTLSLLRCIFTEGKVYYDGIPTDKINLDALRSKITIIPQMPELLSGTLRQNLDPFDQYDDATLHDALRAAGLYSLQGTVEEGRLTLESTISSGGGNLSVGQRQILALARALVRGSKLLILDEATSAIDYETDTVIQNSLRRELPNDVTLITVAHRLQTIMDADKILVLDAGRIVEFDSPKTLLQKEGGTLRSLVDESNDKDILYAMAEGKRSA
ncbi:atp-binding cassette transporter [Moniliophthora roreri]|uniref:Putative atp-binding cassette transporter n=1 Tax=Moniliophthora roreri TaxID=221103 RepID=A0A0W0FAT0_MONRR|nr:atp-binding cassette transporter [Moniliophthora roreri]